MRPGSIGIAMVLLSIAWTTKLSAEPQTALPFCEWQYAGGVALAPYVAAIPSGWTAEGGVGEQVAPRSPGANRSRSVFEPFLDLRYRDTIFVSSVEGVGANFIHRKGLRAGAAFTYDLGRDAGKEVRLRGLDSVNGAIEAKAFVDYVVFPVVLRADVRRALGGYDGVVGDLGAYLPAIAREHFYLLIGPSLTYESLQYQRSYYGVSQREASRSQYPPYEPSGGFDNVRFGFTANLDLTRHWSLQAMGAVERYLGSVRHSPLINSANQSIFGVYVSYQWP